MEQKKVLIILTGLAAAGAGMFFLFKDDDSKIGVFIRKITGKEPKMESGSNDQKDIIKPPPVTTTKTPTTIISSGCSGYINESFPLKKCMTGSNVEAMQTILNKLYTAKIGTKLTVDGDFGPGTEAALYKATSKRQLTQDQYLSLASAATAKSNIDGNWFTDLFTTSQFYKDVIE